MKDIVNNKNHVCVLLATYNGARYLPEQLDSLKHQTFNAFDIIARDDGSTDESVALLEAAGCDIIPGGFNVGPAESFLRLLRFAYDKEQYDYFFFCDQDDIWFPQKIELSLKVLKSRENDVPGRPLLLHTDLVVVDAKQKPIKDSLYRLQGINPVISSVNRLLLQNTVTGCTSVLNKELAKHCIDIPGTIILHDWAFALAASLCGEILYIDQPTINYRQHGSNTVGAKRFISLANLRRLVHLIKQRERSIPSENFEQARAFLRHTSMSLSHRNKILLREFVLLEDSNFLNRALRIFRYRFLKHGALRNIVLLLRP